MLTFRRQGLRLTDTSLVELQRALDEIWAELQRGSSIRQLAVTAIVTGDTTAEPDQLIALDSSAGDVIVKLPPNAPDGCTVAIAKVSDDSNTVTAEADSETISGSATFTAANSMAQWVRIQALGGWARV